MTTLPDPRAYFASLEDPRRDTKNKLHSLSDILLIVFVAVLSGIEDWVGMVDFARLKEQWFRKYIELPNGIPSHDTLSNVIGRIKPKQFSECFTRWVSDALPSLGGQHIAIDGKSLNGSVTDKDDNVYIMSAFASEAKLVLTQSAVDGKGNEIKAIPPLLDMLELEGSVVTIDAIGAQKKIVQKIVDAKADFVISLKGNQGNLHDAVIANFRELEKKNNFASCETLEKSHGRIETRAYFLNTNVERILQENKGWPGIKSVGMVESTREVKGKITKEERYYISSLTNVDAFSKAVREHWSIENTEHWILDVQFREDEHVARKDHRAANLALVRRVALNLLRRDEQNKRSIRRKKRFAALDDQWRDHFLFGASTTAAPG
jgi:predicted transposase YbfD/YdcC